MYHPPLAKFSSFLLRYTYFILKYLAICIYLHLHKGKQRFSQNLKTLFHPYVYSQPSKSMQYPAKCKCSVPLQISVKMWILAHHPHGFL